MHLPLMIAAHTGLRRSEVLALRWDDVDLEAARLRVRQAASFQGRTVVLVETKTKNAHRTVGFGPALVAVMRQAKADQALRRLASARVGGTSASWWTTRTDPRSTRSG